MIPSGTTWTGVNGHIIDRTNIAVVRDGNSSRLKNWWSELIVKTQLLFDTISYTLSHTIELAQSTEPTPACSFLRIGFFSPYRATDDLQSMPPGCRAVTGNTCPFADHVESFLLLNLGDSPCTLSCVRDINFDGFPWQNKQSFTSASTLAPFNALSTLYLQIPTRSR